VLVAVAYTCVVLRRLRLRESWFEASLGK
jgi:hypothetical protein